MRKRSVLGFTLLMGCFGLGGCEMMDAAKSAMNLDVAKVWLTKVHFEVAPDLNNNAAVTVHLLIIYDKKIFMELAKLNSAQYFQKLDQYKRDSAQHIDWIVFEVVPGQHLEPKPIQPSKGTGIGVLIFASYETPGDHRAPVAEEKEIILNLGKADFKVEKVKDAAEQDSMFEKLKAKLGSKVEKKK